MENVKRLKGKDEMGYSRKRKSIRGQMVDVYQDEPRFKKSVLVSAVKGLIKFHEERIETAIRVISDEPWHPSMINVFRLIDREYESINAIEHWLEDAI